MVKHFQEAEPLPRLPNPLLSDLEFSRALDHLVIACVDIVLQHQGLVLLAKRNQHPRADWWLIGGRMHMGEAPLQTAVRKIAQETNLGRVASDRLQFVGTYSTSFTLRKQHPQNRGLHSINMTYSLHLNSDEVEHLHLIEQEYERWEWLHPNQLNQLFPAPKILDQALLQILQDSFR
jgi:ADP-ribose pyrophosphatase YjhB (NUDIX family)